MPGPSPIQITITGGASLNPLATANAIAILSSTQINALAMALINSMTTVQLAAFAQTVFASLTLQSATGVPNTGQAYISTSGFVEVAQ